jgi:hypothetical protein
MMLSRRQRLPLGIYVPGDHHRAGQANDDAYDQRSEHGQQTPLQPGRSATFSPSFRVQLIRRP